MATMSAAGDDLMIHSRSSLMVLLWGGMAHVISRAFYVAQSVGRTGQSSSRVRCFEKSPNDLSSLQAGQRATVPISRHEAERT